jgi:hypothetical protein
MILAMTMAHHTARSRWSRARKRTVMPPGQGLGEADRDHADPRACPARSNALSR